MFSEDVEASGEDGFEMGLGLGKGFFWGDDCIGWVEGTWAHADAALGVYRVDGREVAEGLSLVDDFGDKEEVEDQDEQAGVDCHSDVGALTMEKCFQPR